MNRLPVIVRQHIAGFRILLVFTVVCGFIYPLVMLGVSQAGLPQPGQRLAGVSYNGHVVGSSLLCQEFVDAKGNPLPQYFQPRPSDAVVSGEKNDYGCDPLYSAASNLGPTNPTEIADIAGGAEGDLRLRPRAGLGDTGRRGDRVGLGA
jgi:K+-transporting ATPase ATPase C chain